MVGRELTFKECELLEQCLTDVQKMLIDMEHNAPGWFLTGSCLNNATSTESVLCNTQCQSTLTKKMFLCSDCINNKSTNIYVYKVS